MVDHDHRQNELCRRCGALGREQQVAKRRGGLQPAEDQQRVQAAKPVGQAAGDDGTGQCRDRCSDPKQEPDLLEAHSPILEHRRQDGADETLEQSERSDQREDAEHFRLANELDDAAPRLGLGRAAWLRCSSSRAIECDGDGCQNVNHRHGEQQVAPAKRAKQHQDQASAHDVAQPECADLNRVTPAAFAVAEQRDGVAIGRDVLHRAEDIDEQHAEHKHTDGAAELPLREAGHDSGGDQLQRDDPRAVLTLFFRVKAIDENRPEKLQHPWRVEGRVKKSDLLQRHAAVPEHHRDCVPEKTVGDTL